MRRGWVSRIAAACITGAALVAAGPAHAQFGGGNFRGMQDLNEPEFNAKDVLTIQGVLKLDDNQRMLAEAFLEEYHTAFRAESEKFRMRQEELREEIRSGGMEGRDWRELVQPIREAAEEFGAIRSQLGKQFLADTQAILTPEQAEQWPEVERVLRRQKMLPGGMLSGESVDLYAVVDASRLDEAERLRIDPILSDYSLQLDSALQQRDADMPRAEEAVVEAFRSGDLDAAENAVERQLKLRLRIRDLNEQFSRLIEAELAGPTTFRDEYLKAAYPSVYGDDYYQELFEVALNLPDLDETQRSNIQALQQTFEQRLSILNQDLVRTLREHEPKRVERMVEMIRSRMNGERSMEREDPVREGFEQKSEVAKQYRAQLEALLTSDQAAALPAPPQRPQRGGQFGGFEGGRFQQGARFGDDGDEGGDDDDGDDDDDDEGRGRGAPPVDDRGFPPGLGGGGSRE